MRRQLAGACNNFNQLMREIHRRQVHVSPVVLERALDALKAACDRV